MTRGNAYRSVTARPWVRWVWPLSVLLLSWALPDAACAVLGGDAGSVHADAVQLQGALRTTQANTYQIHEIQVSSGTVVREYTSPTGVVFGVTWQGPFLPDLRNLLGPYFEQYVLPAQTCRRLRGPLVIESPGFVLESGGHLRAFAGRAYDRELLPAGLSTEDIR